LDLTLKATEKPLWEGAKSLFRKVAFKLSRLEEVFRRLELNIFKVII
jgi:hypothetical protein